MLKSINKIVYALSLFSAFILLIMLMLLDILPNTYLAIIFIVLLSIYVLFGLLSWKLKKRVGLCSLIILESILGVSTFFIGDKMYETNNFLEALNKIEKENIIYYVMVNKNSTNHKINDIMGKEVGTYLENDKNREVLR